MFSVEILSQILSDSGFAIGYLGEAANQLINGTPM